MHNTFEPIPDIRILCTHTFEAGHTCASPALRGEAFCYHHHPTRKPIRAAQSNHRRAQRARHRTAEAFELQAPTTPQELQLCLNELTQRIAANRLSTRRGSQLLRALQLASRHLKR